MPRAFLLLAGLLIVACRTAPPPAPPPPVEWLEVVEGLSLGQDGPDDASRVMGVEGTPIPCPSDRRSAGPDPSCVCFQRGDARLLLVSSAPAGALRVLTGAVLLRGGDAGCAASEGDPLTLDGVSLDATRLMLRRWDFHLPNHGPLTATRARTLRVPRRLASGDAQLHTVLLVKRVDVDATGRVQALSAYLVEAY